MERWNVYFNLPYEINMILKDNRWLKFKNQRDSYTQNCNSKIKHKHKVYVFLMDLLLLN